MKYTATVNFSEKRLKKKPWYATPSMIALQGQTITVRDHYLEPHYVDIPQGRFWKKKLLKDITPIEEPIDGKVMRTYPDGTIGMVDSSTVTYKGAKMYPDLIDSVLEKDKPKTIRKWLWAIEYENGSHAHGGWYSHDKPIVPKHLKDYIKTNCYIDVPIEDKE